MIGVYSPFYIAAVYWPLVSGAGGNAFFTLTAFGLGLILAVGAWLSTISVLLLLDNVRHRIWGFLCAISYPIVFPSLLFYAWILPISGVGVLTQVGAWAAVIAPLVGFVGGVWGYLWQSSSTVATAETVDVKSPSRLRFPRDKPVIPALLSLVGTALPLFILYVLVGTLLSPPQPQPPQEGSVGPDFGGLFLLFLPFLVGGAAFFVLFPTIFSIFLLLDPRRHRAWGAVLSVWWGIPSAYLLAVVIIDLLNGASSTTGSQSPSWYSWYTTLLFTPILSLAGGVWGFFWHTGVNPRTWTPPTIARTLRGLSGRVTVGGVFSIVFSIFASPVLAILPFVLVVGNMQLGRNGVRSKARGLALMGLVVASGLFLLAFEMVEYLNAWWEVGPRVAGLVSLGATILAGSGLVWSIRGPRILQRTQKPEQTLSA